MVWLLHVPGDVVRGAEGGCRGGEGGGAHLGGVGLQAVLLVVSQLSDHDAAEVLPLPAAVVQQLADLGGARALGHDQLVVLLHQ